MTKGAAQIIAEWLKSHASAIWAWLFYRDLERERRQIMNEREREALRRDRLQNVKLAMEVRRELPPHS